MSAATPRLGHRQSRVLAQSMMLDEEGGPKLTRKAWFTFALGAVFMMVWAGFISIDDLSKTHGLVVPGGEAETVRHQDGGTVSEILVKDGDIVVKGQPLIRFDDKAIKDNIHQMEADRAQKAMLAAQLKVLGQGGDDPDFSFAIPRFKDIAKNELLIFAGLKQLVEKRRRVLSGRVTSIEEKLQNIIAQERTLSKDASLLKDELKLRQDLFKKGLTPRNLVQEAKKKVDRMQRDLADLAVARKSTTKSLSDSRINTSALITRLKERALDEFTKVTTELEALDKPLEDLKKRLKMLTVIAPVKGAVGGSHAHPLGADVSPGAVVVNVTPLGAGAAIEVRIASAEINRVRAGQPVSVRVKASGFNRYGGITGRLLEISPSAFSDEQGATYYRGTIALDRDHVGDGLGKTRLLPGMAVEADIRTGSKTLFATLLD
ncbi:MAG: HlyD family type I secretion periplasmic adaptor subunit [Proteobacteria bacterium]|nr:HlyD family type I secretion periplasmic adaptor subunit [Pseudomonadota bacterium]